MHLQAKFDFWQSLTGVILGLFLWTHLVLVSSILISPEAMLFVTKMMEAAFLSPDGEGYPFLVSIIGLVIGLLVVVHAVLAMRKLPHNLKAAKALREHQQLMPQKETHSWQIQAITGLAIMLFLPAHLYVMIVHPDTIGPIDSSVRIASGFWWVYLPLLLVAEFHAAFGLYRVAIKWQGERFSAARREKLRQTKWVASLIFIIIGLATLWTYYRLGVIHL